MKKLSVCAALLLLCGCFKIKDELTIQPDGSGTVVVETRLPAGDAGAEMMMAQMESGGGGTLYPPTTEAEAKKFFPGKDFNVTFKQDSAKESEKVSIVTVSFRDLNALLRSPYGKAHALTAKIENGSFVVKAISGTEGVARFAEMKPDGEMGLMAGSGFLAAQKKTNEMRFEFRLTLPNAVAKANGTTEGKSTSWIAERAKVKDADAFAQELGKVMEASCSAASLKFSPTSPPRLALQSFAELSTDNVGTSGPALDTNAIAASAKFVPCMVRVTRSLDLSGEGGYQANGAQLLGVVELPREFEPEKWGEVKLEEAVDAKGNSLKTGEDDGGRLGRSWSMNMGSGDDEDEKPADDGMARHVVTLDFKPPEWKVKEISRIRGAIMLHYFKGAPQIVKLTNAIPANWIVSGNSAANIDFDGRGKPMNDPKLRELGLSLRLQMGMVQSGMTMLTFQTEGSKTVVTDAQIFDAQGRPWPTFIQNEGGADNCQVMVAGKPAAPLSLALLASGGGGSFQVPLVAEHIPLARPTGAKGKAITTQPPSDSKP
jgi:hypothetical protein